MRRVIVAGGGTALGLALVRAALARGDRVAVQLPHPERVPVLADLAGEHGDRLAVLAADADPVTAATALPGALPAWAGAIDLLLHAGWADGADASLAAQRANRTLDDVDGDALLALVRRNALPPLLALRAVRRHLARGDAPRALVVTSWLASIARRHDGGHYGPAAAGAALNAVVRALAFDLEPDGIAVAAASPGAYRTALHGPGFQPTADDVAAGLLAVADALTLERTGAFLDWKGEPCPW